MLSSFPRMVSKASKSTVSNSVEVINFGFSEIFSKPYLSKIKKASTAFLRKELSSGSRIFHSILFSSISPSWTSLFNFFSTTLRAAVAPFVITTLKEGEFIKFLVNELRRA